MVAAFKYLNLTVGSFRPWEAAAALQFFLMFMLIFYNDHCYKRYLEFYAACMEVLRSSIFFVQELIISVPYDEVEKHRQVASRYILATVHLFYMNVTGGAAKGVEWHEICRKGLLTRDEARMLAEYPGRVTLILTSWAMQVVLMALDKDIFWEPQKPHAAHVHNRLNLHTLAIIQSSHRVCNLLALPIPFLYFHLMNSILLVNFLVLGVAFAIFKTWLTAPAYGFAVLVYKGLRKVSIDLSEPFEQRASDFPVAQFLDYAFDHSVGLIEAFSHPDAYELLIKNVNSTQPFSDGELTRSAETKVDYSKTSHSKANPFGWHKPMPFQVIGETKKKHLKRALTHMLVDMETVREAQNDLRGHNEHTRENLLVERREGARDLRNNLIDAQEYLDALRKYANSTENKEGEDTYDPFKATEPAAQANAQASPESSPDNSPVAKLQHHHTAKLDASNRLETKDDESETSSNAAKNFDEEMLRVRTGMASSALTLPDANPSLRVRKEDRDERIRRMVRREEDEEQDLGTAAAKVLGPAAAVIGAQL